MSEKISSEIQPKKRENPQFFELAKLIIGFVLTGILGTVLTQHYKTKEAQHEQFLDSMKGATSVFYDAIDTCDKRHYYALRYWSGLHDGMDAAELAKRWEAYEKMVIYWNENRYRNDALLSRYFGPQIARLMMGLDEKSVLSEFVAVNDRLVKLKSDFEKQHVFSDQEGKLKDMLDRMDTSISALSAAMQAKMKEGAVDQEWPQEKPE